MTAPALIEGYASLFTAEDLAGDRVRPGAFARSLRQARPVPMLLHHKRGAIAGNWTRIVEDGRGLFVRGLVDAPAALEAVRQGLNGLSIGFRARLARPQPGPGRELIDIDLVEISLVSEPMQPAARFTTPMFTARAA
ncbi:MAG: HK97 family phage prohead protease [Pseudomonadota bacterium]